MCRTRAKVSCGRAAHCVRRNSKKREERTKIQPTRPPQEAIRQAEKNRHKKSRRKVPQSERTERRLRQIVKKIEGKDKFRECVEKHKKNSEDQAKSAGFISKNPTARQELLQQLQAS